MQRPRIDMRNGEGKFFKRTSAATSNSPPFAFLEIQLFEIPRVRMKTYLDLISNNSLRLNQMISARRACSQASFKIIASRPVSILPSFLHRHLTPTVPSERTRMMLGFFHPSVLELDTCDITPLARAAQLPKRIFPLYLMHTRPPSRIWSHRIYRDWRVMSRSAFMTTREK